MSEHYTIKGESMALVNCYSCGVRYLIPRILNDKALDRRPSVSIYCPNGHHWHYIGETDADKERRRAQRAEQENARLAEELAAANRRAERETRERKRILRRATAGTCPCCNRTFQNVARHMKTKHPNVVPLESKSA